MRRNRVETQRATPDAEFANNVAAGLLRCHRAQLDENIQHKVESEHPIIAWLTICCGVLYNVTHVGSDVVEKSTVDRQPSNDCVV